MARAAILMAHTPTPDPSDQPAPPRPANSRVPQDLSGSTEPSIIDPANIHANANTSPPPTPPPATPVPAAPNNSKSATLRGMSPLSKISDTETRAQAARAVSNNTRQRRGSKAGGLKGKTAPRVRRRSSQASGSRDAIT